MLYTLCGDAGIGTMQELVLHQPGSCPDSRARKGVDFDGALAAMFELSDAKQKEEDNVDDAEEKFWKSLQEMGFAVELSGKHPICSRWKRAIAGNKDLAERYNQKRTQSEKADFREEWARGEFEKYELTKIHRTVLTEEEINDGYYYPLARIAVEEGGGPSGTRAAVNYALMAISIGGKFVMYSSWTKSIKFLYYVQRRKDIFSKAWEQHSKWSRSVISGAPESAGGHSGRKIWLGKQCADTQYPEQL